MDFIECANTLKAENKSFVNTSQWVDDWEEYYVIFADLIAFASRCIISPGITLNNIVRFHRAVNDAVAGLKDFTKYQFTDACYILTKNPKTALIISSNIQNECFLQNYVQIKNMPHVMFYQMILPKVVISKGNILRLKEGIEFEKTNIEKVAGISPRELLAGDGIVTAYYLEKSTTGGLISCKPELAVDFKKVSSGDAKIRTNSLYKRWRNDKEHKILTHDKVVDIPWLLLQPKQAQKGELQIESTKTFKEKLLHFDRIWKMNFTEHLAERTGTDTLKQYAGGLSHLCELVKEFQGIGGNKHDIRDISIIIEKM